MLPKWGWIALGVLGAAAVIAVLLAGRDPGPAARSGPRWRRRLLGAGLAALSVLGFVALRQVQARLAPPPAPKPEPEPPPKPAEPDPLADRMRDAIRALEAALAAWPDDADAVRALLARTDMAIGPVRDEPPADWVPSDPFFFDMWIGARNTMRVTASPTPEEIERMDLCRQAQELQRLAADRLYHMTGEIADTFEWQTITWAWQGAEPWSRNGAFSGHGGSIPERRCAEWKLGLASEAIDELERRGLLAQPEARLLAAEASRLTQCIHKSHPDGVTCYIPGPVNEAQFSTDRLRQRLALLRGLDADRKVTRAVLGKVAESIRQEVETSAGQGSWGCVSGYVRTKPPSEEEKLRAEVTRLLEGLGSAGGRGPEGGPGGAAP